MRQLLPEPVAEVDPYEVIRAEHRPCPDGRPWLLVDMVVSLDGAITVAGRSRGLGNEGDHAVFHSLRAVADVVMAAAGTVRAEGYGPVRLPDERRAHRVANGQQEVPPVAVVTSSLDLDWQGRLFTDLDNAPRPLVITVADADRDRRRSAEQVAEVIVAGEGRVDLSLAMAALAERGVDLVCCEGGPSLNRQLVTDDLVDELAVSQAPMLVGGPPDAGLVGHPDLDEPRALRLDRLLGDDDGYLFGRYLVDRSHA